MCRVPYSTGPCLDTSWLKTPRGRVSWALRAEEAFEEERLWIDGEYHPTVLAGVVSLHDLQRLLDALSLHRHPKPCGTASYLDRDPYHSLFPSPHRFYTLL